MRRRYVTVDVFTNSLFGGNPLAVVLDAEGLSTAQMQAIAREFNYSETTFVLPPRDASHDAEVRIFMVDAEIPFAGHPNVGTAFVLASRMQQAKPRLLFEEKAGLVPVEILRDGGRITATELTAPQPLERKGEVAIADAAACLSLSAADITTDRHPPHVIAVGMSFLAVELASRDALARARPDPAAFARTFPRDGTGKIYLYTRDVPDGERPCEVLARMFFPSGGSLAEDPATGSATAAAIALFADLEPRREGEVGIMFGQGFDMGRPSLLRARAIKRNGAIASIHVGGACVPVMEGTFVLPGDG